MFGQEVGGGGKEAFYLKIPTYCTISNMIKQVVFKIFAFLKKWWMMMRQTAIKIHDFDLNARLS